MKRITLVLPYYRNADMLRRQFEFWRIYTEETRQHLQIIITDDASPMGERAEEVIAREGLRVEVDDLRLYRILTDLRWNWLQCKNLGAREATNEWLLITDIDHVVPPEVMLKLMRDEHDPNAYYMFSRCLWPDMEPRPPHPNSFLMTKSFFWKVGGYDETYAGHYGTDVMWRQRCAQQGPEVLLTEKLFSGFSVHIADASTRGLERIENRDPQCLVDITAFKERHGLGIQTLRMPWMRVL